MENIYFYTEEPLTENTFVMDYYIDHLSDGLCIYFVEGTYAEGVDSSGISYEIHASGDGDFNNHKIEFVEITK